MALEDFENTNILPSQTDVSAAPQNEGFNLPQNTNGGNIANAIDSATLGGFDDGTPDGAPQADLDFVRRQSDPLGGEQAALSDATNELFMPGLNKSIRVGGTSGQLTGSRDIFVAQGGLTPFAAIERKKAAQQDAAIKRQKDLGRFKTSQPKLSKDPRFNDNIISKSSKHDEEFISRAQREFGKNWQVALTSPETKLGREYIQGKANLNLLAGKIDQVVDLQAEVESAIESGDQFVSDATLQLHEDFKTLSNEFSQEGGSLGAADLGGTLDKLQTSQSLDQFIKENDVLDNIDGEILQRAGIDASNADHFRKTTRYTEDFAKGVATQAKRVKGNVAFRNREDLQEGDIAQILGNLKGKTDKRTASVSNKRAPAGGFSDKPEDINDRIRNIEVLQKAFFNKDGTIGSDVSEEAKKVKGTLIGSEVPGVGKVIDVEFVKGKDGEGDFINLQTSSGSGRSAKKSKQKIDLTDPESFVVLNGIMNTSKSENLKIRNEAFRGQDRRTNLPDKPKNVNELKQKTADGKIAIFNGDTKEFIRFE